MIVPGNNRAMQKRRKEKRVLFGKAKKELFLEHLAANCDVAVSADVGGVAVGTVYDRRMKDPEKRTCFPLVRMFTRLRGPRRKDRAAGGA